MEVKQLQSQYDDLESRLLVFKDLLKEKDSELQKQRTLSKLQSDKISLLSLNNDELRHHVQVLTKYITETLKESLPSLPPLPGDNMKEIDMLLSSYNKEKKSKKRIRSGSQVFDTSNHKADLEKVPKKQKKNFDFAGSEVLNAISNLQEVRRAAQQAARASGRYTIVTSFRISLFEALSLFLSIKNVVLMNKFEVFLPRVLEMLMDLIDLERVILYVCEKDHMYSVAQAGQITKQMIIMKGYFHLYSAFDKPLIISQAYEDPKFDKKYDELGQFKTNNLVCVPLRLSSETIGILECANKRADFIKEEIILLSQVANQLAFGLAGKLFKDTFQSPSIEPSPSMPNKSSLLSLAHCIKSFLLCEKVLIFAVSKENLDLIVSTEPVEYEKVPVNFSIVGLCLTSERSLRLIDAKECSMYNKKYEKGFKEVLVVPVGRKGVVLCVNKQKGFNERDEVKAVNFAIVVNQFLESHEFWKENLKENQVSAKVCDFSDEVMLAVDYDGKVIMANQMFCELVMKEKERVLKCVVTEVFEHSADMLMQFLERSMVKKVEIPEVVIKDKRFRGNIHYLQSFIVLILMRK
jgi:hypothetical protein